MLRSEVAPSGLAMEGGSLENSTFEIDWEHFRRDRIAACLSGRPFASRPPHLSTRRDTGTGHPTARQMDGRTGQLEASRGHYS